MFNRLRSAIFGEPHQAAPASIVVEPTELVLSCADTNATLTVKVNGQRIACPHTEWVGQIGCRIFDGQLGFQLLVEACRPSKSELDLVRRIVAYEYSLKGEALDAIFAYFDDLRRNHGVDFPEAIGGWSRDQVADLVHSPCCFIDDLSDDVNSKACFIISFSTDLDEEHGVDVLVNDWQVVDCGCLV